MCSNSGHAATALCMELSRAQSTKDGGLRHRRAWGYRPKGFKCALHLTVQACHSHPGTLAAPDQASCPCGAAWAAAPLQRHRHPQDKTVRSHALNHRLWTRRCTPTDATQVGSCCAVGCHACCNRPACTWSAASVLRRSKLSCAHLQGAEVPAQAWCPPARLTCQRFQCRPCPALALHGEPCMGPRTSRRTLATPAQGTLTLAEARTLLLKRLEPRLQHHSARSTNSTGCISPLHQHLVHLVAVD